MKPVATFLDLLVAALKRVNRLKNDPKTTITTPKYTVKICTYSALS